MSILIKGMEMPTEQYGKMVITLYPNGHVAEYIGDIGRVWEAVPVPPHGRLIDADVLTELCRDMQSIEWNKHAAPYSWAYAYEDFENVILDAPAIIEAEEATQKDGGQDETQAGPYDLLYEEGGYNSNGV